MKRLSGVVATVVMILLVFGVMTPRVFAEEHDSTYEILRAQEIANPNRDYMILVNQNHKYEFGSFYDINLKKDLVYCTNDVDGDVMAAEKTAYLAYTLLKRDLAEQGIKVGIYDGYRSAADQDFLIDMLRTEDNPVWDVGLTEHHTGLLLTIVMWDDKTGAWAETLDNPTVKKNFDIMHAKAADYGFILRYPEGKESITGMSYRPADMRYVGTAENAHAIMDSGLTLEEYVASLGK